MYLPFTRKTPVTTSGTTERVKKNYWCNPYSLGGADGDGTRRKKCHPPLRALFVQRAARTFSFEDDGGAHTVNEDRLFGGSSPVAMMMARTH